MSYSFAICVYDPYLLVVNHCRDSFYASSKLEKIVFTNSEEVF